MFSRVKHSSPGCFAGLDHLSSEDNDLYHRLLKDYSFNKATVCLTESSTLNKRLTLVALLPGVNHYPNSSGRATKFT
ncbi:MAG: hypothetical protein QXR24_04380 [Thermosphaera sp.]